MKSVLILIDNFYPAYKGGGPIQSITNLITSLEANYNIYVVTSAYDLQSKVIMQGIIPDAWNKIILPGSSKPTMVWYSDKVNSSYRNFKRLIGDVMPDCVYLNGIFSYNLFMVPLLVFKNTYSKAKVIICPRGMLQKGALADKSLKKKLYLKVLKFSGLLTKVVWHATNNEEKDDIVKHFGSRNEIQIAMNMAKMPVHAITYMKKSVNLDLVYLSLITEKKNLLLLLELLKQTSNISLDIYGPVKDTSYWNQCLKLINEMPGKVKYLGSILPSQVQDIFSRYHASILLTKGENFGHALYESLSVGRPIITSNFTPWNNLEEKFAGWNLDINDRIECINKLNAIKEIDESQYARFSAGAYNLAKDYFARSNELKNYEKLFS